jgi:hypothetical protein
MVSNASILRGNLQSIRPVWHGVSKGVEDSCRQPALRASHPQNGHKAVSGVSRSAGIEGLGMAGPGETFCHTSLQSIDTLQILEISRLRSCLITAPKLYTTAILEKTTPCLQGDYRH